MYFKLNLCVPSHTTIANWVKKIGYATLNSPFEQAQDWILIVDESIQIGNNKLLVILGIRAATLDFKTPLSLKMMRVCYLASHSTCNGLQVSTALAQVKQQLGGVAYAVADQGASIQKGLALQNITQIPDISHIIGNFIKKQYQNNLAYKYIMQKISLIHAQIRQTKIAYLLPPAQGKKCRFMNLKSFCDWANKLIAFLQTPFEVLNEENEMIKTKFDWLLSQQDFFSEMHSLLAYVDSILAILKSKGIAMETIAFCKHLSYAPQNPLVELLQLDMNKYFDRLMPLLTDSKGVVDACKRVICSSDVIESTFGRYKNLMGQYYNNGITDLALAIPAFTTDLHTENICKLFENTKQEDVEKWKLQNIETTLLQRRQGKFPKKRGKVILTNTK